MSSSFFFGFGPLWLRQTVSGLLWPHPLVRKPPPPTRPHPTPGPGLPPAAGAARGAAGGAGAELHGAPGRGVGFASGRSVSLGARCPSLGFGGVSGFLVLAKNGFWAVSDFRAGHFWGFRLATVVDSSHLGSVSVFVGSILRTHG